MSEPLPSERVPYTGRLSEILERMARVEEKLDSALTHLSDKNKELAALEARVRVLENALSGSKSSGDVWRRVSDLVWALGLAIIGTGIWFR